MILPEDLGIALWVPVLECGHGTHGGWSVDSRDGVLVCACGETLFVLEPVTGVTP